ncbi:MAG TPA: hypothetical protein VGB59_02410 [Allosphingosinicella sp.]|jgi:hypothetical protein
MEALILALFVLLPAMVLVQLPVRARRYFLAAAATALVAYTMLMGPNLGGGALLVLPLALIGIIAGAILIEVVVFVRRMLGKNGNEAARG